MLKGVFFGFLACFTLLFSRSVEGGQARCAAPPATANPTNPSFADGADGANATTPGQGGGDGSRQPSPQTATLAQAGGYTFSCGRGGHAGKGATGVAGSPGGTGRKGGDGKNGAAVTIYITATTGLVIATVTGPSGGNGGKGGDGGTHSGKGAAGGKKGTKVQRFVHPERRSSGDNDLPRWIGRHPRHQGHRCTHSPSARGWGELRPALGSSS